MFEIAKQVGIESAKDQANDIANRTLNEVWIAMHQAGYKTKSIMNVREHYIAVLNKTESVRLDGAGDDWCRNYCMEHGLPYEECDRST